MFCSTIIPTVNRPTLTRAVQSVLNQDYRQDDFEVIVVNDSGRPLSQAAWQEGPQERRQEGSRFDQGEASRDQRPHEIGGYPLIPA